MPEIDRSLSLIAGTAAEEVAICIRIDEFCIKNDGFYTKNDEFCITNTVI